VKIMISGGIATEAGGITEALMASGEIEAVIDVAHRFGARVALWQRESRQPVILHSDRGCQFTSDEYQRFLKGHNLTCSMSGVGSCADNAACECFYNPRRRRKLEALKRKKSNLTQPSVVTG
jgi:transposase InsO family protein